MSFDIETLLKQGSATIIKELNAYTTFDAALGLDFGFDTVPEHLAKIGLSSAKKMTELKDGQRLFKPQPTATDIDEELFLKWSELDYEKHDEEDELSFTTPIARISPVIEDSSPLSVVTFLGNSTDDEEEVNVDIQIEDPSVRKQLESTMPLARQLYTFLKQSCAHRWLWYEFVDSYLDQPILSAQYDMERFLTTCCPRLMTRYMPRRCWQILRRSIGRARRYSAALIAHERMELEISRRIIRFLQERKFEVLQDERIKQVIDQLPAEIPFPLSVDARVTTFLKMPRIGIYEGRVMSHDTRDATYRVKFDMFPGKQKIFKIRDYRLQAMQPCHSITIDDMLCQYDEGGIYTKGLLVALLDLLKLIKKKQQVLTDIVDMNEELERYYVGAATRRESKPSPVRDKRQRQYAAAMISLHTINADIMSPLNVVYSYNSHYQKELKKKNLMGNTLLKKCRSLAEHDFKVLLGQKKVRSLTTQELIVSIQTIMYLYSEIGRSKTVNVNEVVDDLIEDLVEQLPSKLSATLNDSIKPILQEMRTQRSENIWY